MKTLFKMFVYWGISFLLLASTCKKEVLPNPQNLQLNTPFEIPVNGELIDPEGMEIKVNEITDVRCPVDLQCFWAGNAKVELIMKADNAGKQISLCIGQCDTRYQEADTVEVYYREQAFNLILMEVKPYPGTDNKKKSAVFKLQKK